MSARCVTRLGQVVMVVLFGVVAPRMARADGDINAQLGQPTKPDAAEHLKKGNGFYKIGEFDKAIEEYKAGSLAEAAGVFQFNLAQAFRQQGNYEKAIWHYERFLAMQQPTGELKEMVDGFITTMRGELDKAASHQTPTEPGPVEAQPTDQAPVPDEPQVDPPQRGSWLTGRRKIAIGVGAAGVLTIGAGIFFGLRANDFESDAEELCPEVACADAAESNRLLERGQDNALYANISYGVGAAAIAGAAILWFTGAPSEPEAGQVAVRPLVSAQFTGIGFGARF